MVPRRRSSSSVTQTWEVSSHVRCNLTSAYGCRLTVGRGPHFQHYSEDIVHASAEAAREAVRRRAIDLNVRGFLAWLQGTEPVEAVDNPTGTDSGEEIEIEDEDLWGRDAPRVSEQPSMDHEVEAIAEGSAAAESVLEANLGRRSASRPLTDDPPLPVILRRSATPIKLEPDELFVPRPKPVETDWQSQLACKHIYHDRRGS